jgi:hypothetical protein
VQSLRGLINEAPSFVRPGGSYPGGFHRLFIYSFCPTRSAFPGDRSRTPGLCCLDPGAVCLAQPPGGIGCLSPEPVGDPGIFGDLAGDPLCILDHLARNDLGGQFGGAGDHHALVGGAICAAGSARALFPPHSAWDAGGAGGRGDRRLERELRAQHRRCGLRLVRRSAGRRRFPG